MTRDRAAGTVAAVIAPLVTWLLCAGTALSASPGALDRLRALVAERTG